LCMSDDGDMCWSVCLTFDDSGIFGIPLCGKAFGGVLLATAS
jgi:hypothetical protein